MISQNTRWIYSWSAQANLIRFILLTDRNSFILPWVHAVAFVDVSVCFFVTWRNALVCCRGTSECARGYICLVACFVNEAENDMMFFAISLKSVLLECLEA